MRIRDHRHIFFDIDDTITYYRGDYTPEDFVRDVFGVLSSGLSAVSGLSDSQSSARIRSYADSVIWYDYGDFIREFGLDGDQVWEGLRRIHREHLGFHEDAVNLIRFLAGDPGFRLYVISNNPLSGCLLKLAVAGLTEGDAAPGFTRIFGTNVTHGMKSQAHTWRRALELIGSDGRDVLTIGDNLKEDGLIPRSCGVASSVIICRHGVLQGELPSGMTVSHDLNEFVEEKYV